MTAVAVPTKSNGQRYSFLGTTALINAYAEQIGTDGKGQYAAVPCDGSVSFNAVADTPMRGFIYLEDLDCIYAVFTSAVYKITYNTTTAVVTSTRIGSIPGTDVVQMVRNQKTTPQIGVLCSNGIFVIESDAITKISDTDLPTAISIAQQGGYTIFGISDGRFFISSINEMKAIDGTDFATAEQSPDKLIRVWADRGELFLMSQRTVEVWRNTGNTDFPFEPLINRAIPRGIMSANSVASFDNTFGWVGENAIVYRMNGYTPIRISNYELEAKIRDSTNQSGIIGFSWSRSGHEFYTLTDGFWTYTYDAATNLWHQRKSYREDVWQMRFSVFAWSMVLVGSIHTGTIYYLDNNTYTEAGDPMIWTVRFPPMHVFPNGGIVDALHFDMATGYGLVSPTAQGYDPDVMLRIYKDGGNTVSIQRHIKIGKRGKFKTRVSPKRLGKIGPQGMVTELSISDPVARSVVLADAKVRPLKVQPARLQ